MKTILFGPENKKSKIGNEIRVGEDTQFVILDPGKGKEINLQLVFEKSGVAAEILGIFEVEEKNNLVIKTSSRHVAPNTSCNTFVKAILNNKSAFDYEGKIIIAKNAVQTTAFLRDDVLVAGENTNRNSRPVLEIDNNDVKASHGSTTGRIDEEQLYYLTSRGLGKKEASKIIKEGFLLDITRRIKDETIREKVENKLKSNRKRL